MAEVAGRCRIEHMFEASDFLSPTSSDEVWVRAGVLTDEGVAALEQVAPGPVLAGLLASIDLATVSPLESDCVLTAWSRQESWTEAGKALAMVKVAEDFRGSRAYAKDTPGAGQEQIAKCMRISPRSAGRLLHLAECLTTTHRATWDRLARGELTAKVADTVVFRTDHLLAKDVKLVEAASLDYAMRHTPAEVGRHIDRVIAEQLPETLAEECDKAADQRYVRITPMPNAMAYLEAYLPIQHATEIKKALDARARQLKDRDTILSLMNRLDPNDLPGIDEYRADALTDATINLVDALTKTPSSPYEPQSVEPERWQAHVHLDLATALGIADNPGHIDGYGPIPASLAREIATNAEWNMWITRSTDGLDQPPELLRISSTSYRPSKKLAALVRARDQRCRFPGCETKATLTDLDHALAWNSGGKTTPANLGALCRRHHRLKTHSGWDITASRANGVCDWRTPLNECITIAPEYRLATVPQRSGEQLHIDDDPPPF